MSIALREIQQRRNRTLLSGGSIYGRVATDAAAMPMQDTAILAPIPKHATTVGGLATVATIAAAAR